MPLRVARWFTQRFRRTVCRALAVGAAWAGAPARAADWGLPRWAGEVHGQLLPLGETGPRLAWTFTPATPSAGVRTIAFRLENPAMLLSALATFDAATGDGSWRIEEGRIDLGAALPALAPSAGDLVAGLSTHGMLSITGEGLVRRGRPSGAIKISWQDGAVENAKQGWSLQGIALTAEVDVASLPGGEIPVALAIRTITTARFGARNFSMNGALAGARELAVKAAQVEIAGGEVAAEPFTVPLSPPALKVKLRMTRVGLQDIAALVPTMLTEVRGRVDGTVALGWDAADGFQLGEGEIALDEIEPTVLRLAPNPGFLTAKVAPRLAFIAGIPEPLARWIWPANPAYLSLTEIELGKTDLRLESLKIHLTPRGDGLDRTASVEAVAKPVNAPGRKESVIGKVIFKINVSGPLSQVLRFGMSDGVSFDAR